MKDAHHFAGGMGLPCGSMSGRSIRSSIVSSSDRFARREQVPGSASGRPGLPLRPGMVASPTIGKPRRGIGATVPQKYQLSMT